jgi:hypothetical protein
VGKPEGKRPLCGIEYLIKKNISSYSSQFLSRIRQNFFEKCMNTDIRFHDLIGRRRRFTLLSRT